MLTFTTWTHGRRTAEYNGRRYEVIDQISTKNSIALLVTLTREPGVDEANTQLTEFPTSQVDRRAAEVLALETAFQFAALGEDYDPETEQHGGLPRLTYALNLSYALHRHQVNKK